MTDLMLKDFHDVARYLEKMNQRQGLNGKVEVKGHSDDTAVSLSWSDSNGVHKSILASCISPKTSWYLEINAWKDTPDSETFSTRIIRDWNNLPLNVQLSLTAQDLSEAFDQVTRWTTKNLSRSGAYNLPTPLKIS